MTGATLHDGTSARWTMTHRPHHMVYRIVGEQWEPRSHALLSRWAATACRSLSSIELPVHRYLADATAEIRPPSSKTGQPG
jgi:hypothetical protein